MNQQHSRNLPSPLFLLESSGCMLSMVLCSWTCGQQRSATQHNTTDAAQLSLHRELDNCDCVFAGSTHRYISAPLAYIHTYMHAYLHTLFLFGAKRNQTNNTAALFAPCSLVDCPMRLSRPHLSPQPT
jgi:hypothetical protein